MVGCPPEFNDPSPECTWDKYRTDSYKLFLSPPLAYSAMYSHHTHRHTHTNLYHGTHIKTNKTTNLKSTTMKIIAVKSKELEIFQASFSYQLCIKSFSGHSSIRATDIKLNSQIKIKKCGNNLSF